MHVNWQANTVASSRGRGCMYRPVCPIHLRNQRKVGGQPAESLCVSACVRASAHSFPARRTYCTSCFGTRGILSYDLHKDLICRISVNNMWLLFVACSWLLMSQWGLAGFFLTRSLGPPQVKNIESESDAKQKRNPVAYFHATQLAQKWVAAQFLHGGFNSTYLCRPPAVCIKIHKLNRPFWASLYSKRSCFSLFISSLARRSLQCNRTCRMDHNLKQGLKTISSQHSAKLSVPIRRDLRRNTLDICPSN